MIIGRNKTL
jgi:ribonuclease D